METLYIKGGRQLIGEIPIHGAKNSALPLLAATLLIPGETTISHCPRLSDVKASMAILRHLGCRVTRQEDRVTVDAGAVTGCTIPDRLMREMRSSIVFLGAIAARCGEAVLSYPGGCELGPRPIDLHLAALRRLGAEIEEAHGSIRLKAPGGLVGTVITLPFPSVGATENVLLAACTAKGTTRLYNPAKEPEIGDLCRYLNACGSRIEALVDGSLVIEGVSTLHGAVHRVMPDRIETATYMAAAAAAGGELLLMDCDPASAAPAFLPLEAAGCRIRRADAHRLQITAPRHLGCMGTVRTMPYPGFPTDGAAPLLAAACVGEETTIFVENIFENRYRYVDELRRMGARIHVDGRVAVVEGQRALQGAAVTCTDLRGGAALLTAALAAQGETRLTALHHLDRGYENLEGCLTAVGACLHRKNSEEKDGNL